MQTTNLNGIIRRGVAVTLVLSGLAVADDARELTWEELIPEGAVVEQPAVPVPPASEDLFGDDDFKEDSFEDYFMPPPAPMGVVDELDGVMVKLPGFVVPLELDGDGDVKEFLLVPYFGACIHYPPPPPNQMVYVSAEDPFDIEMTWSPIWVTGELETDRKNSEFGAAEYSMAAANIEEYEY